ncbi:hypothetical protein GUITHDRAFT_89338 [Guillardia theta CCMP2712]|uniref:Uncharacterized protein n=1 Tax=Guillardia theta (strain CCMP2712) TaxID=905079 RepID=L1IRL6_GUITC|nr:hypothetical protein GUITHDRAFT_89338 [Guillardia theta CCMP2712]EKX38544.1 hypothetical protein GUITHDRAFT_89338 [Guillardia theta CCMP2712]|eukprot:XP_005825524.1 hypothetical protein GUITHDRAFT_89338 [Guillardia theta CCMP2712]
MRRMLCACVLWAVLGAWICPKAEAASSVSCGGCTFHVSDEGLLWREGSCADSCTGGLSLTSLEIRNITNGTFHGLSSLRLIQLGQNKLQSLPAGIFEGLSSVEQIHIPNNMLYTLPAGIFDGLSSLQSLQFHDNQLQSLPAGIFDGLSSLKDLGFYRNKLESLPAGIFHGRSNLLGIHFDFNQLKSLPAGIFDGLSSLQKIDLAANKLSCVSSRAFAGLSSLFFLNLEGNNLLDSPTCGHFTCTTIRSQDCLLGMCCLYLDNNQLSSLPDGKFDKLTSLRRLHLDNKNLESLSVGIVDELSSLECWAFREQPVHPHSRPGPLWPLLSDPCHGLHKSFASEFLAGSCQHQSRPVHPQNPSDGSLADDSSRSHRHYSCIPDSPTSFPLCTRKQEHCQSMRNLRPRPS